MVLIIVMKLIANHGVDDPPNYKLLPSKETTEELIVITHGVSGGSSDSMQDVIDAVTDERPAADILLVDYTARMISNTNAFSLAESIN